MIKDINYYRAISNSYDCTIQEAERYDAQNALLYDFDSNPSCKTVLLNGVKTKVIVYIETDIVTGGKSYKVRCKPNQELKIGDILTIDNEIWFVSKVDIEKNISYAGNLVKATCILKFYKNGIYRELPCYINIGTRNYINERDNDYLRLPTSLYTAYCPDLGYLTKQDCNIRFFIRGYVYRAIGIDNLTVLDNEVRDGLIIMKLQDDAICEDDNIELEIANYWSNQLKNDNGTISTDTQYKITIDFKRDYVMCGEKVTIHPIVTDNNNNNIDSDCVFNVTDENGNDIDYITILSQTSNMIQFKVSSSSKILHKKVKLKIIFNNLNNSTYEKIFTIQSVV